MDLLFKWMPYAGFNTYLGIIPHMGLSLGAPKVQKMQFWENPKWLPLPQECLRKKSSENKKVFHNELQLKCARIYDLRCKPETLEPKNWFPTFSYFMAPIHRSWHFICYQGPLWGVLEFSSSQPHYLYSHTFPLKMMNPKRLMSVASHGLCKERGLLAPPQYLKVSLQAAVILRRPKLSGGDPPRDTKEVSYN